MGEHRAPPRPPLPAQEWEKTVGLGADYGAQKGVGLKEGVARILEDADHAPMPVDPRYLGFKESMKTLLPEIAGLKDTARNLLGRLAIWRTTQPQPPTEHQQLHEVHQAMQVVEQEIHQQEALPTTTDTPTEYQPLHLDLYEPQHAAPHGLDSLTVRALREATTSLHALDTPTMQLPLYRQPGSQQAEHSDKASHDQDHEHQPA